MNNDSYYYVKLTNGNNIVINDLQLQLIVVAIKNKEKFIIIKKDFKLLNIDEIALIEKKEHTDKILGNMYGSNTYPRYNKNGNKINIDPINFNN